MAIKQAELRAFLRVIADYHEAHGFMPTLGWICFATDLSSLSLVHRRMDLLQEAGYIRGQKGKARAYVITESGRDLLRNGAP